jgi:hypothetical protein
MDLPYKVCFDHSLSPVSLELCPPPFSVRSISEIRIILGAANTKLEFFLLLLFSSFSLIFDLNSFNFSIYVVFRLFFIYIPKISKKNKKREKISSLMFVAPRLILTSEIDLTENGGGHQSNDTGDILLCALWFFKDGNLLKRDQVHDTDVVVYKSSSGQAPLFAGHRFSTMIRYVRTKIIFDWMS